MINNGYDFKLILEKRFQDVFEAVNKIKYNLKHLKNLKIPVFGICLGHQILSILFGAKTTKMHHGHRGANHPVKNHSTGAVEITVQNHGFVVDLESLPKNVEPTHVNLNDNTSAGISCDELSAFSVQYHPESSPGPHDSRYLFNHFIDLMNNAKEK